MLKYLSAALLLTTVLAGCSSNSGEATDANTITSNDFDHLEGWVGDLPGLNTLSKQKAHSGLYSTNVRPGLDYSLGYSNILGKMTGSRPEKLTIKAWIMLPNGQNNTRLVTEVKDPSKPEALLYDAVEIRNEIKKHNEWQELVHTVTIPPSATANSRILIYMWRADGAEPVYMDDMSISLPK